MIEALDRRVAEFGKQVSLGSWFLTEERQIEEQLALLPYAHYLRQAWVELRLSGVLCVDEKPVAYLCGALKFDRDKKKEYHRFVWNQGLVPLLILLTPDHVEVHSAVKQPEREEASGQLQLSDDLSSLIWTLDLVAGTLELARLVRSIETGQFFQDNSKFFPASEAVDRSLLRNLVHTARRLGKANWSLPRAHALLGRALFVSFLHAREFIKPHYYPKGATSLLDILNHPTAAAKRLLYQEFFPRLRSEFNGTMFDLALDDEERHIKGEHLSILAFFLGKHDVESGQMSLGFDAYDFRFIPVEIISAIYEEFMKGADPDQQRDDGAYYTPRHLAETALHIALEGRYSSVMGWKVLDPACGSGIFLVAMFNLIAEQWKRSNGNRRKQTKAQALLEILQRQIRGVDKNPEACRITAFSLYLALFEKLQPMDIDEFKEEVRQGPFLPPLVWSLEDPIENAVVTQGDFLTQDLPLGREFDLVIGNPPWESRGKVQIALQFVFKSEERLRDEAIGCLLLPSAILVNHHGFLGEEWFRKVTVEKIVQLADFRFVLFEATHPCFILRYAKRPPGIEGHEVVYETPKLNRFDRRQGVIVIEPDDHKIVTHQNVLRAAMEGQLQALWNRKFWGTPRDETFLRRLDSYSKLAEAKRRRKWEGGVGCKPYYPGVSHGKPEPLTPWKLSDKFLPNRADFPEVVIQAQDLSTLRKALETTVHRKKKIPASLEFLHRKPSEAVFSPPMVVYSKGFTKAAFCDYAGSVRFFDGLRSITGSKKDANLLRFLAAVLGSRLFRYITFHSGSNIGVGRDQIHLYESLKLPFPLPEDDLASPQANEIIRDAAGIIKDLKRAGAEDFRSAMKAESAKQELEALVGAYFSVTSCERILIDDTLSISEPSIHRHSLDGDVPSLEYPEKSARRLYADMLCDTLNRMARKQGIKISAGGIASKELNLIFMTVIFGGERKPYVETAGEAALWTALGRVNKAAKHESGPFSYLRGFSYFESDRLHMLKPATMRNWSRTAALNDADAIFEHLVGKDA
jgi:hypothetical protein